MSQVQTTVLCHEAGGRAGHGSYVPQAFTALFTGSRGLRPNHPCKRKRPTTPRRARLYAPSADPPLFPPDCATHARPHHATALALVSYGMVLVRVRVRLLGAPWPVLRRWHVSKRPDGFGFTRLCTRPPFEGWPCSSTRQLPPSDPDGPRGPPGDQDTAGAEVNAPFGVA
jgi:hypothetical protein